MRVDLHHPTAGADCVAPDPTQRFADRVADYVRFRPSYPPGVVKTLQSHAGLRPAAHVADIGSGTGIFAQQLLAHCARVYGIEPNSAMREAGEALLASANNFTSVGGRAEATGLPDASIDLVTAAQAFHWFDLAECRREFRRILRPGGVVALVWNERMPAASPFLVEYEALLQRHATDYARVNHIKVYAAVLSAFFGVGGFVTAAFPNRQEFDFEALKGRLLSSSYAPNVGHPGYGAMLCELSELFAHHEQGGVVQFLYTTKLHFGPIT